MSPEQEASTDEIECVEDIRGMLDSDEDLSAAELVEEARGKNVVHVSRLESLVEEWREKADTLAEINQDHGIDNWGEIGQIQILADELQELVEDA